jgi:hypothetical protein
MTVLDDLDIHELSEDGDLEVKKAAGRDGQGELPHSFFESYVAMANSSGGTILRVRPKTVGRRSPSTLPGTVSESGPTDFGRTRFKPARPAWATWSQVAAYTRRRREER